MSKDTQISDELKQFISKIIVEHGFKTTSERKYGIGSESGDGFMSKTTTVDITEKEKSLHLFCKSPLGLSWHNLLPVEKMFANEIYFYNTIYPAYQEFIQERNIGNIFGNIPKCYGIQGDLIVLENLKRKGYDLFGKGSTMNDEHIVLTMKILGKFYAISYAFKDQKRRSYDIFTRRLHGTCFTETIIQEGTHKLLPVHVRDLLKHLDPIKDKNLIDHSHNLEEILVDAVVNVDNYPVDYPVIIQGDCWSNNVMYLYDDINKSKPIDIMLIDWQVTRVGSPAVDLAYFFYPICSKSTIGNLDFYLQVFYDEFSEILRRLGSDPQVLYPISALRKDWQTFAKYSFALSFFNVKTLLMEKNEMPNGEEHLQYVEKVLNGGEDAENFKPKMKKEHLYIETMKTILRHFVEREYL